MSNLLFLMVPCALMSGLACPELAAPCPPPPPPAIEVPAVVEAAEQPLDPPVPVVVVRVRVAACALPGEHLEYHLCVENCSPAPAYHVLVHDKVPPNASLVRAIPEPTQREPELQWQLGTLPGGARREIVLVLAPAGTDDVKNCARVQFEHGQCVITRIARAAPAPDVVPEAPAVPPPPPMPPVPVGDAKLTLALVGPKEQAVKQPTSYQITASNPGTAAAGNVLVTAILPAGGKFVSASDNGRFLAGQVAWLLGDLVPGASRTAKLELQYEQAGEMCVKATALADPQLKAEGQVCTLVRGASAMLLEMFDTKDPIPVGGETSYTIRVLNQGFVPVTNIVIKAVVPPELALVQAKGPVDNKVAGQILLYEPLPTLEPGGKREYEVFVKAVRPGDARFKIEMTADQLKAGGPVHEEESTRVYQEEGPAAGAPPVAVPQKRSASPRRDDSAI
jgi:uncharacterized repeat protein (TIGR01451 family)